MMNDTDEGNDDDHMMNILPCVQVKMEEGYEDDQDDPNKPIIPEEDNEDDQDDSNNIPIQPIEQIFLNEMPIKYETDDNSSSISMESDSNSELVEAEADPIADRRPLQLVTEGIKIKECVGDTGRVTYLCIVCNMSYMKRDALIHHMTTDHKGLVYFCSICREIFSSNENLKIHVNTHLNTSKVCDICGLILSSKRNLESHVQSHAEESSRKINKSLICSMCDQSFQNVNSFSQHILTHKSMMISCKFCQFWCDSELVYKKHLKKHINGVHDCNHCEKTFQSVNDLNCHISSSHSKKTNNIRGEKCSNPSNKEAVCNKCEVVLRSKKDLTLHKKSPGCKTFYCSGCYSTFTALHLYYDHAKKCSEGTVQVRRRASFGCGKCGKKFKNNSNLKKHMSSHSRETIKCKLCGKVYNYYNAYMKHMSQHTKDPL